MNEKVKKSGVSVALLLTINFDFGPAQNNTRTKYVVCMHAQRTAKRL